MSRKVKELMVRELVQRFGDIPRTGCVLIDHRGMSGNASVQARRHLAEHGGEMMVVKNSLFVRALEQIGVSGLDALVEGPTTVVRAQDPVQAAKMAVEIVEMCGKIALKGGYAEGKVLDAAGVESLSRLPGREQLLSQALGSLSAPLCGFAYCLKSLLWRFASVLDQLRQKREQEGEERPT